MTLDAASYSSAPAQFLIEADICDRLRTSPYKEVRGVRCHWHQGILTLRGRVSSYYLKQRAQAEVQGLDCVEVVNNQLDVICPRA